MGDSHLRELGHLFQAGSIGVHKGKCAILQVGGMDHLPDGATAEEEAACTDDDYFGGL